ncbi:MAG TPA: extracellular solute-binding protein [Candidatus Limnocylindrales bacterium]|jgi:multiple sugar transport system substrate-binding protein|nr:extracellular solute-binding protein [Candidatus Limnocylindrales bacterium]
MRTRLARASALLATFALLVTACGPSSPATPSGGSVAAGSPSASASATPFTGEPVEIRWYCCLGGGEAPEQKAVEDKVVADFNASHPNIKLTFEVVTYDQANGQLTTEIQSGNGPDIVGPVGIGGANAFHGQWLDLGPYITKTNYDLSGFPSNVVDIYKLDEGQVGIPFAIYPSALFYEKGLFEEAGLSEPPHKYGEKYKMKDGNEVDWTYDVALDVAKQLTVDSNNKDATQAGFDPRKISQWGFEFQRDDLRGLGAYYGPGSLAGADGKTVEIPDAWKAGWKDYYKSIWTNHTSLTGPQFESKDINPSDYPFFTGHVGMSENFLWSTYGLGDLEDWDLAAIPSYNGTATAAFNADTFRILKGSKHPDEAFEVLTYLLGDASKDLLTAYGGFPARTADQAAGIEALQAQFKQTVDWQAAVDGIEHADNPNFESFMPAYNESLGLVGSGGKYLTRWGNTAGLDMDKEIQSLQDEMQAIWDKTP